MKFSFSLSEVTEPLTRLRFSCQWNEMQNMLSRYFVMEKFLQTRTDFNCGHVGDAGCSLLNFTLRSSTNSIVPSPAPINNCLVAFNISRSLTPFAYFSQSLPGAFFGLWRPKQPSKTGGASSVTAFVSLCRFNCTLTMSPLIVPAYITSSLGLTRMFVYSRRSFPMPTSCTWSLLVFSSMLQSRMLSEIRKMYRQPIAHGAIIDHVCNTLSGCYEKCSVLVECTNTGRIARDLLGGNRTTNCYSENWTQFISYEVAEWKNMWIESHFLSTLHTTTVPSSLPPKLTKYISFDVKHNVSTRTLCSSCREISFFVSHDQTITNVRRPIWLIWPEAIYRPLNNIDWVNYANQRTNSSLYSRLRYIDTRDSICMAI